MIGSIDELWDQVCAAPNDADLRRVLGDALLDAGDPRGELIQLQSLPLAEQTAEIDARCDALIAANWQRWLGPLAGAVERETTYFRHGFLDEIVVDAPLPAHRELHTVRAVRPGALSDAAFAATVVTLPHEPVMLELRAPSPELAAARAHWQTRGLCLRFLDSVLDLAPHFAEVEQLELSPLPGWAGERAVALLPQLSAFPRLRSIVLDCRVAWFWYPEPPSRSTRHGRDTLAGEALLAAAAADPRVSIRR